MRDPGNEVGKSTEMTSLSPEEISSRVGSGKLASQDTYRKGRFSLHCPIRTAFVALNAKGKLQYYIMVDVAHLSKPKGVAETVNKTN